MEKDYFSQKDELTKLREEKETMTKKMASIELNSKKKLDLVNNYCNELRMRFEFNQKLFSEKLNFDNSLILEVQST
jgi:hypothetical protein